MVSARTFLIYVLGIIALFSVMVSMAEAGWLNRCPCYSVCKKACKQIPGINCVERCEAEINLSPYALWNQNGITVAGWANGTNGSSLSQLSRPVGISISNDNILYVADSGNHRIMVVYLNSTAPNFAIGSGYGSGVNQFDTPTDTFVTNSSVYITDVGNSRVQMFSLNGSNLSTFLTFPVSNSESYFYIDDDTNIYFSDYTNNIVLFFNSTSRNFSIVAGTTVPGNNNDQLNKPYGLFVNSAGTIYIADCYNHRIMKWFPGSTFGIVVAGNGTGGSSSSQLSLPTDIIVDINGYMYISESTNARITRWAPNSTFGMCIAACTGISGVESTQLNAPHALAFDNNGSLYVSDWRNQRVQKFQILQYQKPSYNQPKFSSCATWKSDAITFANSSLIGIQPRGIFIDNNNTIYVAAYGLNRIQVWLENSQNLMKNFSGGLSSPYSVFVAFDGDVYIDNGYLGHQVEKRTLNGNGSVSAMYVNMSCYGLFIDIYKNIYCSMYLRHLIIRKAFEDQANITKIVAGNGSSGASSNMLHGPQGIFVDTQLNLYVADCYNNRIQFFQFGQLNATTIVGITAIGTISLTCPTDVILDADGYLFITDNQNNRIVGSGPNGFRCIVGCSKVPGSASNQLYQPWALSFDSFGNLFVTDMVNNRIQKFLLSTNSCSASYNQPKFCPNATWDSNATTILDNQTIGFGPQGLFITTNNTIYLICLSLNYLYIWPEGGTISIRNMSSKLNRSYSLFITNDDNLYIDNGAVYHRVDRWTSNITNSVPVINVTSKCWDLFIDINNNLYCSNDQEHQVVRISLNDYSLIPTIVAGNGTPGSTSNLLNTPNGIFVDINLSLYVADCLNNRVQRFSSGQIYATTIVGNETNNTIALDCPGGIAFDSDGYIFIIDRKKNRIIGSGPYGFRCLFGCLYPAGGSTSDALNKPHQMKFDNYGNIFVTDKYNNRLQKFLLMTNSCDETTTTSEQVWTSVISTTNTIETTTSYTTISYHHNQQSSTSFIPNTCSNSTNLGLYCNITNNPCQMLRPCLNNGTCIDINLTSNGYNCSCPSGFIGPLCEYDNRPCKSDTCWNNGTCHEISNRTFSCQCKSGWQGIQCETKINYCENIICSNNGICQSLVLNYSCKCLGDSYSGLHCEITSNKITKLKRFSISFAYIVIIALISVALFIGMLDLLKYCFNIDPVGPIHRKKELKKREKKKKPISIIRYIYVNPPLSKITIGTTSSIEETIM